MMDASWLGLARGFVLFRPVSLFVFFGVGCCCVWALALF